MISIILVEDHSIFLEGLQSLLSGIEYLQVRGKFSDGESAVEFLRTEKVDLVFLDIGLPGSSGVEVCREIKKLQKKTSVIALSNHTEKYLITEMLAAGANGYLLKNASLPDLINSINQVMQGQTAMSEEIRSIIFSSNPADAGPPRLTRREKEVLQLVADGLTTAAMAARLFVSVQTVETHRYNLMKKFEVNNSINLVRKAMQMGLL